MEQYGEVNNFDFIIIGGGIIGASLFYKLHCKWPKKKVLLLEKEKDTATHQTGRNSGVIHSGIYYKPGSLKAKTCLDGYNQIVSYARENRVPHEICGKIIVAKDNQEKNQLIKIFERGKENGLSDLKLLNEEEMLLEEPFVNGIAALKVPQTGIIDYRALTKSFIDKGLSINPKSKILKGVKVKRRNIYYNPAEKISLKVNSLVYEASHCFFCAGLHSDILAKVELGSKIRIVPFRGDYYILSDEAREKVKNLIYPVANPKFPFLGVHFTRMTTGEIECGPNAVFSFKKEGYKWYSFNFFDSVRSLTFLGTWKLFYDNWKYGVIEYKKALSKELFLRALQELIPTIQKKHLINRRAGVRAQALYVDGKLLDDFLIITKESFTHVINAPSPAATASLAIADEIIIRYENRSKNT